MARLSKGQRRRIAARFRAIQLRFHALLAARLRSCFRGQAARAVGRYLARESVHAAKRGDGSVMLIERKQVDANDLLDDDERAALEEAITSITAEQYAQSAALADQLLGLDVTVTDRADPRVVAYLRDAGERVVDIHQQTLDALRDVLSNGSAAGYSPYEIAHGVARDDFRGIDAVVTETYRGRADTIARTELAMASGQATVDRYREADVTEVDVDDGEDCGWTEHDDPDLADGSRRDIDDADENEIAHPNCVRVFLPVLEGGGGGGGGSGGSAPVDEGDQGDEAE